MTGLRTGRVGSAPVRYLFAVFCLCFAWLHHALGPQGTAGIGGDMVFKDTSGAVLPGVDGDAGQSRAHRGKQEDRGPRRAEGPATPSAAQARTYKRSRFTLGWIFFLGKPSLRDGRIQEPVRRIQRGSKNIEG